MYASFYLFRRRLLNLGTVLALLFAAFASSGLVLANNTAQSLPFSQDWSNTGLITANDDWSGVAGIVGFLGQDITTSTGVDPQTLLGVSALANDVDVIANQTSPNTLTAGGVAEFHITDPTIALNGSGTADAPHIILYLNTTGQSNITVAYNLRDLDGSTDNAIQPVALQYRIGSSGNFTNVPAGFVTDATTGPSLATLVTPVNVVMPSAVDNQPEVQVRIITSNAVGNDEWVGIDDISVTGTPIVADTAPAVLSTTPTGGAINVAVNANINATFSEAVNVSGAWFDITCDSSGARTATVSGGPTTFTLDPDTDFANNETCTVTIFAAQVTDQDADDPPDNMGADFSWSFTTVAAASTTLVINEIDYDQPGTDTAEFLEIKNISGSAINLDAYSVELVNGTGGGAALYQTIDLPDVNLAAGDYFVICANVLSVANCDLDVSPDTNLIQNGAPDAVGLRLSGTLVDAVSYEGNTGAPYTEGSGAGLADDGSASDVGISRFPDGVDTNQNNVDLSPRCITPGAANASSSSGCTPPPIDVCGAAATRIHTIQGSGLTSPLSGSTGIAIEGIVVGDFQNNAQPDNGDLNGFHVQEEDAEADADPATSEGIFVFAPGSIDVSVGDKVRVRGTVTEFNGLTEIGGVSVLLQCSTGNVLPTAATVNLPVTSLDDFERYEGMRVTLPQALVISEYFNYDRFGEMVLALPLTGETRHFTPTSIDEPGAPAQARALANSLRRITLDDGLGTQNPSLVRHPNGGSFALNNRFRGGDTVQNTVGVMDFAFGLYRIQPTGPADYAAVNPRPAAPEPVGGSLRVAAMNTLNFFLTLDYPTGNPLDNKCGPSQNVECRGADADQPTEFTRQRDKLLAALTGLDADIIGLNELENTTGVDPLGDPNGVVAGLNDLLGSGTYAYINTGVIGTDAIRVGLIYKPGKVAPVGDFKILTTAVDPRFADTRNRPALAQTFQDLATGGRFTVVVNHLKSKGDSGLASTTPPIGVCVDADPGNDTPDCDQGDGQGYWNYTRAQAALALVDWLATDPTGSGDADYLIIGDLNSYAKEDPIDAILAGPDDIPGTSDDYTNLVDKYLGTYAYSFVFDGQSGYLDHALASPSLAAQVTGAAEWHINADEPDLLDYDTTFKPPAQEAIYEPNAYRSSDHDPVIVGLNLTASRDYYLHGAGATANPPTLFLDDIAPTGTTEKYKDSASIKFSGGNPWKDVGTWSATPASSIGTLITLSDVHAWLGLKNSDDQGTRFDLRVEVYKNGVLAASGETYCITGVTRNPSLAQEVSVSFGAPAPVSFNGTSDVLSLKVLTRIGTNGSGSFCGGHSNAVGLRLYFDAASRPSRFGATFGP